MGAWIETLLGLIIAILVIMSHPTWVRGLKLECNTVRLPELFVAPYMGAWIETFNAYKASLNVEVAPYMGAWIETINHGNKWHIPESHPTWVRGLKPEK